MAIMLLLILCMLILLIDIGFLVKFKNSFVADALLCHRKDCTSTLECMKGWDICSDKYCFMLRARNVTNPQQFSLRRGCIGDPPEIRYSAELTPFKMLNQCQRIVWKDIEFLVQLCADNDYCNYCQSWVEALPIKSEAQKVQAYNSFFFKILIAAFPFMLFTIFV